MADRMKPMGMDRALSSKVSYWVTTVILILYCALYFVFSLSFTDFINFLNRFVSALSVSMYDVLFQRKSPGEISYFPVYLYSISRIHFTPGPVRSMRVSAFLRFVQ